MHLGKIVSGSQEILTDILGRSQIVQIVDVPGREMTLRLSGFPHKLVEWQDTAGHKMS